MEQTGGKLLEAVREHELRLTPQRAIIFEIMEKLQGHITAEALFREVQQVNAHISLTTVYRTLDLLRNLNLVTQTNLGRNKAYFVLKSQGPHHHLVCTRCRRVEELAHDLFNSVRQRLLAEYDFEAHTEHTSLLGLCRDCRNGDL